MRQVAGKPRRARGAQQIAFSARASVRREGIDDLRVLLEAMGRPDGFPHIPFERMSGVHFARLLLLEDEYDLDGELIPASLVYMSEIDAPQERHLAELAELGAEGVDAAFGLCEDYPPSPDPAARREYLVARPSTPRAKYVNTVGRTLEQILQEEQLRQAIQHFLDRNRTSLAPDAQGVRRAIQQFVRGEPSLQWAVRRAAQPPLRWRVGEALHMAAVTGALTLAAPLLALILPVFALILRCHEAVEPAPHLPVDPEHTRQLGEIEDFVAQNQFSAIGFVKPGKFRAMTIAVVLAAIDLAARHVFTRADLAGVKTIHFARWTMLDGGRRAIFTSNYDGSLESYMDDFIDKVAFGLNASFSNGVGYPKTRLLFFDGAKREDEFKDYLRNHQIPTQTWYTAYPTLSALNIEDNALLRSGLFIEMSDQEAESWLRRL